MFVNTGSIGVNSDVVTLLLLPSYWAHIMYVESSGSRTITLPVTDTGMILVDMALGGGGGYISYARKHLCIT